MIRRAGWATKLAGRFFVLAFALTLAAGPAAALAKDPDHDALPSKWETGTAPGGLNLHKLGASPNHRDIFVEIDYGSQSAKSQTTCDGLDQLYTAFRRAPVANPDGTKGIRLHLDAGKTCPSRSYDLGGSRVKTISSCTDYPGLGQGFAAKRGRVFHLAGVLAGCVGEGGTAIEHGTMSLEDVQYMPYVFMHELGHNLGLDHVSYAQPNHMSVMANHLFVNADHFPNAGDEILDYQRYPAPALDESALNEHAGLGVPQYADYILFWHCDDSFGNGPAFANGWLGEGGIDWNCNGSDFAHPTFDAGTVPADINGNGMLDTIPAAPAEWPLLDYSAGGNIGPPH